MRGDIEMKNEIMQDKATARPWKIGIEPQVVMANGKAICRTGYNTKDETISNAELIVKAVNNYEALREAVEIAIEATLDKVVGQAIKDGTLLENEMHSGLCLLGFIRRKFLKVYEQALKESEG